MKYVAMVIAAVVLLIVLVKFLPKKIPTPTETRPAITFPLSQPPVFVKCDPESDPSCLKGA